MIEKDFVRLLGGVGHDPAGRIVSAKAASLEFIGKMNGTAAKLEGISIDNALGEYVNKLKHLNISCFNILPNLPVG